MIFAAFSDLLTFKIPNWIPIALLLAYLVCAVYLQFSFTQIGVDLLCALVVLVIALALFTFNLVGGGDAKLATASVLWIGPENLSSYGVVVALIGGVVTGIVIVFRFSHVPDWLSSSPVFAQLADKTKGIPYGIALALGGLIVYPHTAIWSRLTGV
jgi:prepilin peptidase CpaA